MDGFSDCCLLTWPFCTAGWSEPLIWLQMQQWLPPVQFSSVCFNFLHFRKQVSLLIRTCVFIVQLSLWLFCDNLRILMKLLTVLKILVAWTVQKLWKYSHGVEQASEDPMKRVLFPIFRLFSSAIKWCIVTLIINVFSRFTSFPWSVFFFPSPIHVHPHKDQTNEPFFILKLRPFQQIQSWLYRGLLFVPLLLNVPP